MAVVEIRCSGSCVLKDEEHCVEFCYFSVTFMSFPCGIVSVRSSFSHVVIQPISELAEFFLFAHRLWLTKLESLDAVSVEIVCVYCAGWPSTGWFLVFLKTFLLKTTVLRCLGCIAVN